MSKAAMKTIRAHALGYPGAHEDFPWGHSAFKVKKKVFLFMSDEGDELSLSTKLPESADFALTLPFAEPTHYGLGKSGWVTATFPKGSKPPLDTLRAWIDESYRAIAPKKMLAELDASPRITAATIRAGVKQVMKASKKR